MVELLSYQIAGIDGQYKIPIHKDDDVKYLITRIKKEFSIIPKLDAQVNGNDLQDSYSLYQNQDTITFKIKETNGNPSKLEFYHQPIITRRNQNKTTFNIYTTINYKSMTIGNEIEVDIENDTLSTLTSKIKEMLLHNYQHDVTILKIKSMKILLFLPGGIPFIRGKISEFIDSFPKFLPNLYAVIFYDKQITDNVLNRKFYTICDIHDKEMNLLLSPDYESEISSLCQISSVLGYIQQNGPNINRMIYSLAKFCPFSPLICGLFNLSKMTPLTGRTIVQITVPLLRLFEFMSEKFEDQSDLFSYTTKFFSYFMNVKVSNRVPCTEFVRPFNISFLEKNEDNERVFAFDPEISEHDWIQFELTSLQEKDYDYAMELTKELKIVPVLSLREMHDVCLFHGLNGPWLYLGPSFSDEKFNFINPEKGFIESDTYENVAVFCASNGNGPFDIKILDSIDPEKVTQLVYVIIDKSGSMMTKYGESVDRFQVAQQFFIEFIHSCYDFHTNSLFGSILFNNMIEERNKLNPIVFDTEKKFIVQGEKPIGGTAMFSALKNAAMNIVCSNKNNEYPNAVLRLIVISDGDDIYSSNNEKANIFNFILQNKIRVDSINVSNEISKELVALSRFSGGVSLFSKSFREGVEIFKKEEFVSVNIRQFGVFHQPNVTENDIKNLPRFTQIDLDNEIPIKNNEYINQTKAVEIPQIAVAEYTKKIENQEIQFHPNQKRIINELRKIISNPDDGIKVFPLENKINVWRVLIKGFDFSLYENKWFYLIIEFTEEYPQNYPQFRFVFPPFHPNITDHGYICIKLLDQRYRSDISILELINEIRLLLLKPNFDNCVDFERFEITKDKTKFQLKVKEWNKINGRDKPEDWEKEWKIQENDDLLRKFVNKNTVIVPEQFLCPITRKIMKEPVKASSGVFYEKSALELYLNSTPSPTCKGKVYENGNLIPLSYQENKNLKVNSEMKTLITKWIEENNYREEDENYEEEIESFFIDDNHIDHVKYSKE